MLNGYVAVGGSNCLSYVCIMCQLMILSWSVSKSSTLQMVFINNMVTIKSRKSIFELCRKTEYNCCVSRLRKGTCNYNTDTF